MSDNDSLTAIDVKAPTLEQAIQQGLEKLGLSRNDVIIEIVEEGSRGVLGMGARDAVVRLTPLRPPTRPVQPPPPVSPGPADEEVEITEPPEEVAEEAAPEPPEAPASAPTAPYVAPPTRIPAAGCHRRGRGRGGQRPPLLPPGARGRAVPDRPPECGPDAHRG